MTSDSEHPGRSLTDAPLGLSRKSGSESILFLFRKCRDLGFPERLDPGTENAQRIEV